MLKLSTDNIIGFNTTGVATFSPQGSDTENVYVQHLKTQPADWIYKNTEVTYSWNSLGHRSIEPNLLQGNYLLFIGCSHTVGISVPLENTFPYLTANELNLPYYNLAVEATGPDFVEHNLTSWLKKYPTPKAIIVLWPSTNRMFKIIDDCVIQVGPWKTELLKTSYPELWEGYQEKLLTDYFEKTDKRVRDYIAQLDCNTVIIEQNSFNIVDYGRDLKHFGIKTHKIIADQVVQATLASNGV